MRYPRNLEIGFELEFGHDITKKEVIRIVSAAFPEHEWGVGKHKFNLVPDGSVNTKRKKDSELVTPAWPARKAVANLEKLFRILKSIDATTDKTTGIHINIGWKDSEEITRVSPLKVLVYCNEAKWLNHFDRNASRWCKAYQIPLANHAAGMVYDEQFVSRLEKSIGRIDKIGDRFINFDKSDYGYIEFRGIGGVNYHKKYRSVVRALNDFVHAIDVARYEDQDDYKRKMKAYLLGEL